MVASLSERLQQENLALAYGVSLITNNHDLYSAVYALAADLDMLGDHGTPETSGNPPFDPRCPSLLYDISTQFNYFVRLRGDGFNANPTPNDIDAFSYVFDTDIQQNLGKMLFRTPKNGAPYYPENAPSLIIILEPHLTRG